LAQPNLRFDGTYLTIDGVTILNSATASAAVGSTTVATFSNTLGNASYFDYHVYANFGGFDRRRAGTVMSVWDSSTTQFTDTSTLDLGSSTTDISFSVTNSGGVISLVAVVTSGTWSVKTGFRII
jgi:hypothetical protein